MKIRWHQLAFTHSCGKEATILEICVSRDGGLGISGICVTCGEEFGIEDNFADLIAKSTIQDYLRDKLETPEDNLLDDFVPQGKPS